MLSAGRVCCSNDYALCDACKAHHGVSEAEQSVRWQRHVDEALHRGRALHARHARENTDDFAPPNPYERGLQKLRAASSTPDRNAEDAWKAARARDLEAESVRRAEWIAANPLPRTLEDAGTYAPPDVYAAGLKALRAKEAR